MAFEIFGFEIQSKKDKKAKTFVTPENTDGATTVVDGGGIIGHYLNAEADAKDEKGLIQKYRDMSFSQEVDGAIEDIINDAKKGKINVRVSKKELLNRRKKWKPKKMNFGNGTLWKYAQTVGPAYLGAATHPGAKNEVKVYADI